MTKVQEQIILLEEMRQLFQKRDNHGRSIELRAIVTTLESMQARIGGLEKALDRISMIPDKGGWEATLKAAVGIARAALKDSQ